MKITCKIYRPLSERNKKKYLELELNNNDLQVVEKNHTRYK
jgi:hypothetical protein